MDQAYSLLHFDAFSLEHPLLFLAQDIGRELVNMDRCTASTDEHQILRPTRFLLPIGGALRQASAVMAIRSHGGPPISYGTA